MNMSNPSFPRFHLAFPVFDLEKTRSFYQGLLGCTEGRSCDIWVDFDFFGHQITAHLYSSENEVVSTNPVDGENVPIRHFGAILEWDEWHKLAERLQKENVDFLIQPQIRFQGQVGEQATLFIKDPSGNVLEFKSFQDESQIFAKKTNS
ncbi:glyoxalase/Bleomycin resistance /Dioxygenase superfamily protein [Lyngbya aestuarii BL J]|uniref:Glyoxalase/Bleomycin resistance /Dioxygenase superfamily protein n=2 Tax=Lyngbya aestuarii TaxID=118322 RepID=U7QDC0_9CYAN|nr:glyoxalase/Bleomycin resistance /Dioxygenase superfamily protein [Lyngbya aestuarii BL J]